MRRKLRFDGICLLAALFFAPASPLLAKSSNSQELPARPGVSHARAVSVSLVEGTVIVQRPGASKWAAATLDMPIAEGASIATARNSFVEVQFENGSTVRLGELSRIDFTRMGFAAHNGYANHLTLAFGFATVNVISGGGDQYLVAAAGAHLVPHGKAEFRTDLSHGLLRVEVFNGRVQVGKASQSEQLKKNQVLTCDEGGSGIFQVTPLVQTDQWDKWVQTRDKLARAAAFSGPGPGMYDWESTLMPFGGMGQFPGIFSDDGF